MAKRVILQSTQLHQPGDLSLRIGNCSGHVPQRGDSEGNVYCGAGGLWITDPAGKKLGRIVHGGPATTNLAFGGADWKTLYFTSRNHLGAVNVRIPGIPVPTAKK